MAHESCGGTYLEQLNGPALGIYQMEPKSYEDLWRITLQEQNILAYMILNSNQYLQAPPPIHLTFNLKLATQMARVYYYKVREKLPDANDIEAIWSYYKTYWNTNLGSATKEDFISNYCKFTHKGETNEKPQAQKRTQRNGKSGKAGEALQREET